MIALRRRHSSLTVNRFFRGAAGPGSERADILWHGARLNEPPWQDAQARVLAFTIHGRSDSEEDLHVILNMSDDPLEAPLPAVAAARRWYLAVDTARGAPHDVSAPEGQLPVSAPLYRVGARAVAVLEARAAPA
jgi:glycogen operon protein